MLKIITSLGMFLLGLLAQAQVTEMRTVSPFSKITATDGVQVILAQNGQQSLSVETPDALSASHVFTKVENNTLKISSHGNKGETVKVYVSANVLTHIKASAQSKITLANTLESDHIAVAISSGAMFNGSISGNDVSLSAKSNAVYNVRIESQNLRADLKSGSKANISGVSETADIHTYSASLCNARNLKIEKAFVNAGDYSSIMINANGYLKVNMTETGKVTYFGTPSKVWMQEDATGLATKN